MQLLLLAKESRIYLSFLPRDPMSPEPLQIDGSIRFGDGFELDLRAYQLRRQGRRLPLERIPMEMLILLLEQRGQLVTRDQIMERIWGKEVFLDVSGSINAAVVKIRRALHDDSEKPRFVETIARKGYRFVAPVHENAAHIRTPLEQLRKESESVVTATSTIRKPTFIAVSEFEPLAKEQVSKRRKWKIYLAATIALSLMVAVGFLKFHRHLRPRPVAGRITLAVLPFENLTGDSSQDYFSDGMTEEMIGRIGRIDPQHLAVIARTSVMHYKHTQEPLPQVGRELGVQYVLEGSVRRASDVVRISVRLIQLRDQTELWSREYDRELNNLLSLQEEIAQNIAKELQLTLSQNPSRGADRPTPSPAEDTEAYELYLRGRYFWAKRTALSIQRSIDYFQQAVSKNPMMLELTPHLRSLMP
jgi:TolB-like protein/DNA-binding winged helix-turn-helix (wHTH) protein